MWKRSFCQIFPEILRVNPQMIEIIFTTTLFTPVQPGAFGYARLWITIDEGR
jgi:hypothetical protein